MKTYENPIPLYVGITDFQNSRQVREMLEFVPTDHRRSLMVGVMMSYKTLNGIPTRWKKIWPTSAQIQDIFSVEDPKVLNTLHYADYDGLTTVDDIERALEKCGHNVQSVQLDMIWPSQKLSDALAEDNGVTVILQIGENALNAVDNNPDKMIERLLEYQVEGVLLDKSMGQGKVMDAEFLRPFIDALYEADLGVRVAVAGGLGPHTLGRVLPLMRDFPDLSIDAQGQLRVSGLATDPIDWDRAREYLSRAMTLFP